MLKEINFSFLLVTHSSTGAAYLADLTVVLRWVNGRPLGKKVLLNSFGLLLDVAGNHVLLLRGQRGRIRPGLNGNQHDNAEKLKDQKKAIIIK